MPAQCWGGGGLVPWKCSEGVYHDRSTTPPCSVWLPNPLLVVKGRRRDVAPGQESMAVRARSCVLLQNAACLAGRNLPLKVVQFRWFPGNQSEPVMSLAEGWRLCSAFGTEWFRPDVVPPHPKVQTFPGVISISLVTFHLPIGSFTRPFYSQTSAFLPKRSHDMRGGRLWSKRTGSKPDRAVLYWDGQHGVKRGTGLRLECCVSSYCVAFNLKSCIFFLSLRFVEPVECFVFCK